MGTTWSTLSSGPDEDEAPATGKTAPALPMSAMGTTEEALQEPPDRFRAALLILYLQGMGTLLPWYALITKVDYYQLIFSGSGYASSFESVLTTTYSTPRLGARTLLLVSAAHTFGPTCRGSALRPRDDPHPAARAASLVGSRARSGVALVHS